MLSIEGDQGKRRVNPLEFGRTTPFKSRFPLNSGMICSGSAILVKGFLPWWAPRIMKMAFMFMWDRRPRLSFISTAGAGCATISKPKNLFSN
jgi:hypothetical protein